MMRHSSVLLIILIAFSAYCFGVMIPYQNRSRLYYSAKENLTITCTGTDEIAWNNSLFDQNDNYAVITETPHRKILQIKNASALNSGIYKCFSTTNSSDFMHIFLFPDRSCFEYRK